MSAPRTKRSCPITGKKWRAKHNPQWIGTEEHKKNFPHFKYTIGRERKADEIINQNKIDEILSFNRRVSSEKGTSMEEGTGLGLLLVKQFLINNKGHLNIQSVEGEMTEFIISFLS